MHVWREDGRGSGKKHGKCTLCGQVVAFQILPGVGLREARCPVCGGSKRNRDLAKAIVQAIVADPSLSLADVLDRLAHLAVYEAQASGPIHDLLQGLPGYVCSEYYPDVPPGSPNETGIRCEDLENLAFSDNSFNLVITQDVFEHLRHPERAFLEIDRVLKPGGHHLFTVPLHEGRRTTRRVHCLEDEEWNLLPPVYHGDPLRKTGSLVHTDFGDDILIYLDSIGIPSEICVHERFYPEKEITWLQDASSYQRYKESKERGEIVKFFRYNSVVFKSEKRKGSPATKLTFTGERFLPWVSGYPIMSYEHLHRYRFAAELVRGKRVLDLGCGEGYGAHMLAQEAEAVIGVDIDIDTVRHAASRYSRSNLKFLAASISQLPIRRKNLFDVIVCYEALEHIADHAGLMGEVKRLLKKDGLLILSTPNTHIYSASSATENPFHVKELDLDQFQTLLESCFDQIVLYGQKVYPSSWIFPLADPAGRTCDFVVAKEGGVYTFLPREARKPRYFVAVASDVPIPNQERLGLSHLCDLSETALRDKDARIAGLRQKVKRIDADRVRYEGLLREKEATVNKLESVLTGCEQNLLEATLTLQKLDRTLPLIEGILDGLKMDGNVSSQVLVDAGELCFALGMFPRSAHFFERAVSLDPENDLALNNLGVVRLYDGEDRTARELFLKALRFNPRNEEARTNLAWLSR